MRISYKQLYNAFKKSTLYRRIAKNFSISFVGAGLTVALGLIQTAILTKNIPVSAYGKVMIVINFFALLQLFLDIRIQDVFFRFFPEFKEHEEKSAIQGLLVLGLVLSLIISSLIAVGIYFSVSFIAKNFYNDETLAVLLKVYIIAGFFIGFKGFFTAMLRLHDKFSHIVAPEVFGSLFIVIALSIYFLGTQEYSLISVVFILAIGSVFKTLIPLVLSLKISKAYFLVPIFQSISSLEPHRKMLLSTIFQTNITGYLKLGAETGGMFLLGVFSTPTQVAYYGIAQRLTRPLTLFQENIQNALSPEIASLWAQKKYNQLYFLIKRISLGAIVIGGIAVIAACFLVKPVIVLVTTADYLNALPVFYIFIFTVYLTLISLPFFVLALCMDMLTMRNLIVSIRFVYIGIAIFAGLNAYTLTLSQFFGALTTRLFFDIFLFKKLYNKVNWSDG